MLLAAAALAAAAAGLGGDANTTLLSWRSIGDGSFSRSVSVFNGTFVALGTTLSGAVTGSGAATSVVEGIRGLFAPSQSSAVTIQWQQAVGLTVGGSYRSGAAAAIISASTGGATPQHIVYVCGSVRPGDEAGSANEGRGTDGFVVKYNRVAEDAAGAHLEWAMPFGTVEDDRAIDIAYGVGGKVWIVGATRGVFEGEAAFAPGEREEDTFACRFRYSGELELCRQLGVAGDDAAVAVALLPTPPAGRIAQDVLILREYRGAWKSDGELAHLDGATGKTRWRKPFGTPAEDAPVALAVAQGVGAGDADRAFVGGTTGGAFHGATNSGGRDAFLFAIDVSSLSAPPPTAWSVQIGGAADDDAHAVALDASDHSALYWVGTTEGVVAPGCERSGADALRDVWVARIDAATGALRWIRQFGSSGEDVGAALLVESARHLGSSPRIAIVGHTHFAGQSVAESDRSWVAVLGAPSAEEEGGGDVPAAPNATQICGVCDYCLQVGGAASEIGLCRTYTRALCTGLAPYYTWCGAPPPPTAAPIAETASPSAASTLAPLAAPTAFTLAPTPYPTALVQSNCDGAVQVPANRRSAALLLGEDAHATAMNAAFRFAGGDLASIVDVRVAEPVIVDSDGALRVVYSLHNPVNPSGLGARAQLLLRSVASDVLCLPLSSARVEGVVLSPSAEILVTLLIFGVEPAFDISARATASSHTIRTRAGDALFIRTDPPDALRLNALYWATQLSGGGHAWWRVDFAAPLNNVVLDWTFGVLDDGVLADAAAWTVRADDGGGAWTYAAPDASWCATDADVASTRGAHSAFPRTSRALYAVMLQFAPSDACRADNVVALERVKISASPPLAKSDGGVAHHVGLQVLPYASSAQVGFAAASALALPLALPLDVALPPHGGSSGAPSLRWDVPPFAPDLLRRFWAAAGPAPASLWLELAAVATHVSVSFKWSPLATMTTNGPSEIGAASTFTIVVSGTSPVPGSAGETIVVTATSDCADAAALRTEVVAHAPPVPVRFVAIRATESCASSGVVAIAELRVAGYPIGVAERAVPAAPTALQVVRTARGAVELVWHSAALPPTVPLRGFTIWEQRGKVGAIPLAETALHYTPRAVLFEPPADIFGVAWRTAGGARFALALEDIAPSAGLLVKWRVQGVNALGRGVVSAAVNWTAIDDSGADAASAAQSAAAVIASAAFFTCVALLCAAGFGVAVVAIFVVRSWRAHPGRVAQQFAHLGGEDAEDSKYGGGAGALELVERGECIALARLTVAELALFFVYNDMSAVAEMTRSIEMDGEALAAMGTDFDLLVRFAADLTADISDLDTDAFVAVVFEAFKWGVERCAFEPEYDSADDECVVNDELDDDGGGGDDDDLARASTLLHATLAFSRGGSRRRHPHRHYYLGGSDGSDASAGGAGGEEERFPDNDAFPSSPSESPPQSSSDAEDRTPPHDPLKSWGSDNELSPPPSPVSTSPRVATLLRPPQRAESAATLAKLHERDVARQGLHITTAHKHHRSKLAEKLAQRRQRLERKKEQEQELQGVAG